MNNRNLFKETMSGNREPVNACYQSVTHNALQIATIIVSVIGFIVIIPITIHSYHELLKLTKLHYILKLLYKICIINSCCCLIVTFTQAILCLISSRYSWEALILDPIFYLLIYIIFLSLLATLIFRLYNTFMDSIYNLSKFNIWLFTIAYIITAALFMISILEFLYITYAFKGDWIEYSNKFGITGGYFSFAAIVTYIIIATYAILIFVKKLMDLAMSRNYTSLSLTPQQLNLINRSSKYISLLSLAMFTSILTSISWICGTLLWSADDELNAILDQSMVLLTLIDCTVNAICLYLQFKFSERYYEKYCKEWIECCWKHRLVSKANKCMEMKRRSKEIEELKELNGLKKVRTNTADDDIDESTDSIQNRT